MVSGDEVGEKERDEGKVGRGSDDE